jgi:hypothetical protein
MNSKIFGWVSGIAYIAFWVGAAASDVGEMSGPPELFAWYLPLLMAGLLIPVFLFGFIAGKGNG